MERYKPKKYKSPAKAIREFCIECVGGRENEGYLKYIENCFFMNITSKKKDQFISIYFFGPLSSFPNMTARTITRAEEKAKRNINILSSPKVYHSMIIPSYIRF